MNRTFRPATVVRLVVVALCLVSSAATAAQAQEPPPAPGTPQARLTEPSLATFLQGKEVYVTLSDGFVREGHVSSINDRELVLGRNPGVAVPLARIVEIRRVTRRIRLGTLLGVAAGVSVSLPLFLGQCSGPGCSAPIAISVVTTGAGMGAGAGAIAGAIANAVRREQDVFFRAAPGTLKAAVTPILTPDRKGVAVTLSWR